MIWVLSFCYLVIGAAIGYFLLGIGYKHGPAPYWHPRKLIRHNRKEAALIVGGMALLWFPLIIYLWVRLMIWIGIAIYSIIGVVLNTIIR